jgi:hypothetical protein
VTKPAEPPKPSNSSNAQPAKPAPVTSFKAAVRAMVEKEVLKTGLPADIADAVVRVESDYNPATIGSVGEIGLMQVRPETAAMLGFRGSNDDLAKPEINIHYGVIYLSKAWRLANGDLCRALMKYRAGHGEETMTVGGILPSRTKPSRRSGLAVRARWRCGAGDHSGLGPDIRQQTPGAGQQAFDPGAEFADRCLCALQAGHARGQPRLLGGARRPRPRHHREARIQMATGSVTLERFRAKWVPVRVKKTRQNKKVRARF